MQWDTSERLDVVRVEAKCRLGRASSLPTRAIVPALIGTTYALLSEHEITPSTTCIVFWIRCHDLMRDTCERLDMVRVEADRRLEGALCRPMLLLLPPPNEYQS